MESSEGLPISIGPGPQVPVQLRVSRELEAAGGSPGPVVVNVNYCHLRELPEELLTNEKIRGRLVRLYAKRNLIATLPRNLGNLQSLCELYLHSNELKELPCEISRLCALESLNVACNNITTISPAIGEMRKLKSLNISRNSVTSLPDELWCAPSLRQLVASANQLQSLSPQIIHCQRLEKLLLDLNLLTQLPPQLGCLGSLFELSVCGNKIRHLPNDFSEAYNLTWLYVDNNPELQCIPASLGVVATIGVEGCDVSFKEKIRRSPSVGENVSLLPIGQCNGLGPPPLLELAARAMHFYLKESLGPASPTLWVPNQLSFLLSLPVSLTPWLMPQGRCWKHECQGPFFSHHVSYCVRGEVLTRHYPQLWMGDDISVSVSFCSLACAAGLTSYVM